MAAARLLTGAGHAHAPTPIKGQKVCTRGMYVGIISHQCNLAGHGFFLIWSTLAAWLTPLFTFSCSHMSPTCTQTPTIDYCRSPALPLRTCASGTRPDPLLAGHAAGEAVCCAAPLRRGCCSRGKRWGSMRQGGRRWPRPLPARRCAKGCDIFGWLKAGHGCCIREGIAQDNMASCHTNAADLANAV